METVAKILATLSFLLLIAFLLYIAFSDWSLIFGKSPKNK